ncbi:MAG: tripartite tricarboxylate transporter substrate binding protein [Alphaproteobacteria bacterium]
MVSHPTSFRTSRRSLLAAPALILSGASAYGQGSFATKPIRFIVPFAAGGSADIVARTLQPHLQAGLGQPVVVENRPGAAGNIGMGDVAQSAPDGHTLALAPTNTLATNQFLFKAMSFDPARAFAPISLLCVLHNLLVVGGSVPAKTPIEFIEWARTREGKINYGSSGVGTQAHLAGELLRRIGGFEATHVAYRNSTEPLTDMIRGEIAFMIAQEVAARPFLADGRVRALGTAALARSRSQPDLPTLDEQGIKGFEARSWFALVTTAGTPAATIGQINAVARAALNRPDVSQALMGQGVEPAGGTPEELASLVASEIAKWGAAIKDAGISAQ